MKLREEAQALWRALYDAPPPDTDGGALLDAIMRGTAPAPDYDRLRSPFLRISQIARPAG